MLCFMIKNMFLDARKLLAYGESEFSKKKVSELSASEKEEKRVVKYHVYETKRV